MFPGVIAAGGLSQSTYPWPYSSTFETVCCGVVVEDGEAVAGVGVGGVAAGVVGGADEAGAAVASVAGSGTVGATEEGEGWAGPRWLHAPIRNRPMARPTSPSCIFS
jgi:hypothetical protein